MKCREIGLGDKDWIYLHPDRDIMQALVDPAVMNVMNLRFQEGLLHGVS